MHTWRCIALSLDLTLFLLKDGWNYILKHWNSLKIDKQSVNNLLYWGKIKFFAKAVKGLSIDYQKKTACNEDFVKYEQLSYNDITLQVSCEYSYNFYI